MFIRIHRIYGEGVMRADVGTSKTGEENSKQKRWYGLSPFLTRFEKMTENSFDI